MSKKKHKNKIVVQKIKEDPSWQSRAEIAAQYNLLLPYDADTTLRELERICREVQG